MRLAGRQHGFKSFNSVTWSFATCLYLTPFLPFSCAQDVAISTSSPGIAVPSTTVSPDASPPTTLTTTSPPTSTDPAPPELFPTDPSSHVQPVRDASVFNYYFLFLFIFAVIIAILLLWFHRRRQQRKQQLRQNGQHALARDLEGWAGTRRFMHERQGIRPSAATREEGLNEAGEAPPPYDGKGTETVSVGAASETGEVGVPLRALVRDERAQEPPGYDATDHEDTSYNVGRRPVVT
ncbi:hypothetical protein HBI56_215340 [Parastagonospora nodorum]|nr:hypothetical protein HBH53_221420 [Parastagonospora nodorum]KAH3993584.1 hypothetical protein HBI10_199690 [Parastagonospora nodorum]KAH4012229.1 hypothetical protein HBI13_190460 [Parastagonospora nodorum]KAH4014868.1 hypothetical protein HBI09_209770 [Parastagonospora nodorum]KAH4043435.1 hypothetical protein HBH49_234070 [Parastagonospora nodorum]